MGKETGSHSISMKDLHDRLRGLSADEVILDVRTPEEFKESHVPGSKNIPHDQVGGRVAELKKFKCVYVHCKAGGRAKAAFDTLIQLGLSNLVCVTGSGMADWIKAGFEIEK